ncbi:MAG: ParB/RepB/Spo0J family partition protein [Acutalibacteraceae bacterium]|nr:ParB/RepB/Spo0J family partition protein [Oscillospiraceae bacterium]
MAIKKGGLGRGLDALFADNSIEEISSSNTVKLKINEIEPNRDQPRKTFDEKALSELADSIAQHGVIQPLLVRPIQDGYQLVAGERRWRAARLAGLTEVPVVVKELSDSETMEIALIENLQREDLNPIEEAEGLQLLIDTYGLTQDECAKRVGKSRPAITNSLRLLNLPGALSQLVRDGKLSSGHARALLPLGDEEKMLEAAKEIMQKDLSVREVERMVKLLGKSGSAEKRVKKRDVYFDEVELALGEAMGRKVRVFNGKGGKGTLEIEFFGKEDLAKIAKALEE